MIKKIKNTIETSIQIFSAYAVAFCTNALLFGTNHFWISLFLLGSTAFLSGALLYVYYILLYKNDTIKTPEDDGVSTLSGNGRKRGGGRGR